MPDERDKQHRVKPRATQRARALRSNAPVPERVLWGLLRDRRLGGLKFRRQQPFEPYIVDYYCAAVRLVVELDGMSHLGRAKEDAQRTAHLEWLGLRVLRVTNDSLLEDSAAVAEWILRAANERMKHQPSPQPSPCQGEGAGSRQE